MKSNILTNDEFCDEGGFDGRLGDGHRVSRAKVMSSSIDVKREVTSDRAYSEAND